MELMLEPRRWAGAGVDLWDRGWRGTVGEGEGDMWREGEREIWRLRREGGVWKMLEYGREANEDAPLEDCTRRQQHEDTITWMPCLHVCLPSVHQHKALNLVALVARHPFVHMADAPRGPTRLCVAGPSLAQTQVRWAKLIFYPLLETASTSADGPLIQAASRCIVVRRTSPGR